MWVEIQFSAGGISVQRQFPVPPRVGDFVTIDRDGETFHLRVDMASWSENPDTPQKMEYFVHAAVLDDWKKEAAHASRPRKVSDQSSRRRSSPANSDAVARETKHRTNGRSGSDEPVLPQCYFLNMFRRLSSSKSPPCFQDEEIIPLTCSHVASAAPALRSMPS